jgi:hypothetical protein
MWCSGSLPNIDLCSASLVSCWLCVPTVLTWFNLLTVCTDQASTVTCAAPSDGQEVRLPATHYSSTLWSLHGASGSGTMTKVVKTRCQRVAKKALRSISEPCIPARSALLTFCTGTHFHPVYFIDAAKLCWQHRCQNMEAGRWP